MFEAGGARPDRIEVPDEVESVVRVVATFPEPGEYMLLAQADNFRATDSGSGDQYCWTNGHIRLSVR